MHDPTVARRAHALPAGGPAVPTPIPTGLPVQAYTLRTAAVAALMLAPAIAHVQPATAVRRAAAAGNARSGRRLSTADVRRYGTAMQQLTLLGAGLALGASTAGRTTERLATQMDIDRENVALVRADQAALEAMRTEPGARGGDEAAAPTDTDASTR